MTGPCEVHLEPIVVATLNIRNRADRWSERAPLLIEQLVALQPDIIGLQEVRRPLGQAGWLLHEVNQRLPSDAPRYTIHCAWKAGFRRFWEGLAVMTRLPVVDTARLDLGGGSRVAQRVRVELPDGQRFAFYNTHLHHAAGDAPLRLTQARRIVEWMDVSEGAQVLTGDFNAEPDSDVVRFLSGRYISAFLAANGIEPDVTAPTPLNRTAASRPGCIDYIFVDRSLTVQAAWLTFDAAADADDLLYPSDHFGIAARVTLV